MILHSACTKQYIVMIMVNDYNYYKTDGWGYHFFF